MRENKKLKQLDLFVGSRSKTGKVKRVFGGTLLKGNAKIKRPLSKSEPIHLVLKSEKAIGTFSMLNKHNISQVDRIVRKNARRFDIRIYQFVNVGNHLHLVIRIQDRHCYAKFIRTITGLIARHVTKKERGPENRKYRELVKSRSKGGFWVARPFSRLISWGRDFNLIKRYMEANRHQRGWKKQCVYVAFGFDVTDSFEAKLSNTG